jgi:hypothetical protein
MLFREIIPVCIESRTKPICNTKCRVTDCKSRWYIRSSGRKVIQLKITIFQEKQFNYYIFLIRVFKIEESETVNTYVGKKGILHT